MKNTSILGIVRLPRNHYHRRGVLTTIAQNNQYHQLPKELNSIFFFELEMKIQLRMQSIAFINGANVQLAPFPAAV
jgi:hypothetical protein